MFFQIAWGNYRQCPLTGLSSIYSVKSDSSYNINLCFYRYSSLLPWYSQDILLISRHGRGLPAWSLNPPILCISFRTNILLSGYSYLVNNPCFNAEVKSGLLHQLYYPLFTLGCYGRVVTVFSWVACIAHTTCPYLALHALPLHPFGQDCCDILIYKHIFSDLQLSVQNHDVCLSMT